MTKVIEELFWICDHIRMNKEIGKSKKNIRLLIVLVYLMISIPFQFNFSPAHSRHLDGIEDWHSKLIIFGIVIVLEIIEYFLNYPDKSVKIFARTIFLIRTFAVLVLPLYEYIDSGNVDAFYFIFIPLLAFYSSFEIPGFGSLLFTLGITTVNIWLDINHFASKDMEFSLGAAMIFQRLIIIIVFYLFAYFWQMDIRKSVENEKLVEKLNKSEENLRIYASEIAKVSVFEERTRIARDMHDSVGHGLTAIQMQLRKALAYAGVDIAETKQAVEAALEVAGSSLQDIRSVLNALRSEETRLSLEDEILPVIETLKQAGVKVELNISGSSELFNYAVLVALFRLIQEGTTNILRHSGASRVSITIKFSTDEAVVIIEDNGRGFETSVLTGRSAETGFGLHGLKERFELIRGSLHVESSKDSGTCLIVNAPRDPVRLIGETNE